MTADSGLTCSTYLLTIGSKCGEPAIYAYMDVSTRMIMCYCREHKPLVRGLKAITIEEALVTEVMNE
jgi:hypothetical protein